MQRLLVQVSGSIAYCSAVVVTKDMLLTAAHCVPGSGEFVLVGDRPAIVTMIDREHDLAAVRAIVPDSTARPIRLRRKPVSIGLPIAVVGFGFNASQPKYSFGHVSDLIDPKFQNGIMIDATLVPGQSGGLVVDENGDLIALARSIVRDENAAAHIGMTTNPAATARYVSALR